MLWASSVSVKPVKPQCGSTDFKQLVESLPAEATDSHDEAKLHFWKLPANCCIIHCSDIFREHDVPCSHKVMQDHHEYFSVFIAKKKKKTKRFSGFSGLAEQMRHAGWACIVHVLCHVNQLLNIMGSVGDRARSKGVENVVREADPRKRRHH